MKMNEIKRLALVVLGFFISCVVLFLIFAFVLGGTEYVFATTPSRVFYVIWTPIPFLVGYILFEVFIKD